LDAAAIRAQIWRGDGGTIGRVGTHSLPKPSTLNRRLMLLKAVCKAMWRQKRIGENLSGRIQTLREPPHKDVYLTREQVSKLADSAPSPAGGINSYWHWPTPGCELGITGPAATAFRAGYASGRAEQNGKATVTVPIPVDLSIGALARELPLALSYWELRKQFIVARKKAKLPATVTLHTLRHTCASWLINAGVDLYTVGKILGHSSPQTNARYAHLATHTLEKAMARLR
jgi:hypothetical protein